MRRIQFLVFLSFLLSSFLATAQSPSGDMRGFVYDKETGEPIPYVNVIIENSTMGVASDVNGFFSMANVPVGNYSVRITSVGYDTIYKPAEIKTGGILNFKFYLSAGIVLNTVTVRGITQEKATEIKISEISITPAQITKLPSVGGEPDLAQYLQVIPGVITTGDQGGQLYIRGGSPIQTKVILDGAVIYNPFHSIGLFSVFETDIIRNVDVFTGGFSGEYGDRISAVIDITTRDGNKNNFGGEISVSPFMARTVLEGPLKKAKNENDGTITYLFTAKHSYLNKTSTTIYPYVNNTNEAANQGIPYQFTDLYGKISINSPSGNKINFFTFNFRDSVNYSDITTYKWNSTGAGANFVIVPSQSNQIIEGVFAYSNYNITQNEADSRPRNSSVSGFNGGIDFTYFIPDGDIKYGFEIVGFQTDYNFFNRLGVQYQQQQYTTELGSFFKFRKVIAKKLVIEPSVRLQYYSSLNEFSPEPRLGLKYNISKRLRVKFAGGFYTQNLISTKSDRDVVNLFTGFLSGPDDDLDTPDGADSESKLQKATHAIAGIEYDATKFLELNVEPYIKYFNQLIEINRNKLTPFDPDFATENGKAYGIDFLAKYDYKNFYLWVAYSIGYITRNDGEQVYPPHYDRRHNLNMVTSYNFGKDLDWELSARWNLGSGFPFTQTSGFYESIDFLDGISTDYTTTNGSLGIIYDEDLNGGRLPFYHRLDVSAKKKFVFNERNKMEIIASVTNIYNRDNIFYFDRVRYIRINQLPVLPALAVSYSF